MRVHTWLQLGLDVLVIGTFFKAGSVLRPRRFFQIGSGQGVLGRRSEEAWDCSVGILQLLAEKSYGSIDRTGTLRDAILVVGNGSCGCVASMQCPVSMRGSLGDPHRASAYCLRGVWVSGELLQIDAWWLCKDLRARCDSTQLAHGMAYPPSRGKVRGSLPKLTGSPQKPCKLSA